MKWLRKTTLVINSKEQLKHTYTSLFVSYEAMIAAGKFCSCDKIQQDSLKSIY